MGKQRRCSPGCYLSRRHFDRHVPASCPFGLQVDLETGFKCPYDASGKLDPYANQHIGQRKLLLAETQFLTSYMIGLYPGGMAEARKIIVVYVGAAPGHHLSMLSVMFPFVKFLLYDTIDFSASVLGDEHRFDVRKKVFDVIECEGIRREYTNNDILFISDIRLTACAKDSFEQQVSHDMQIQREWIRYLKPESSLVKFRLPYTLQHGDKYKYFPGKLMFGIWPKPLSGETRLIVDKADIESIYEYDFKAYEETLAFHNQCKRSSSFLEFIKDHRPHYLKYIQRNENIYCTCFDCTAELETFNQYLLALRPIQQCPFTDLDGIIEMYARLFTRGKQEFPRSRDRFRAKGIK